MPENLLSAEYAENNPQRAQKKFPATPSHKLCG
jgi:hypothetical protein